MGSFTAPDSLDTSLGTGPLRMRHDCRVWHSLPRAQGRTPKGTGNGGRNAPSRNQEGNSRPCPSLVSMEQGHRVGEQAGLGRDMVQASSIPRVSLVSLRLPRSP